jgi:hypothetical protein
LGKGLKDRCVLVEINAAKDSQYLPIALKVADDLNVVVKDTELTAKVAAAIGSMREVMSRVKRLAPRKQSYSKPKPRGRVDVDVDVYFDFSISVDNQKFDEYIE